MSLFKNLDLGPRELVAFVGAGGKSTLLLALGRELVDSGSSVVLTTTTKMGTDQIPGDAEILRSASGATSSFVFLIGKIDEPKVIGVAPGMVDGLFEDQVADYILVEADGARRRALKAPSEKEPVIPSLTTIVVVTSSVEAVGMPVGEAHRPHLVAAITGRGLDEALTRGDVASVIGSWQGGLARIPPNARVVVALTHVAPSNEDAAAAIAADLGAHPRIDRVLSL